MKNKGLLYGLCCMCFIYTLFLELNSCSLYPSIQFPNFKSYTQKPFSSKFQLYSTERGQDVSILEIVCPHENRLFFHFTRLLNKEKTQESTINFFKKKWAQNHPNDHLTIVHKR